MTEASETARNGSVVRNDSVIHGTVELDETEAPVTKRSYFLCGFASIGGILYGYDSGYINAVLAQAYFKKHFGGRVPTSVDATGWNITTAQKSLTTSILSAGTFVGALVAGEVAEQIGRRPTVMLSCLLYAIGVAIQTSADHIGQLIAGRTIAGLGE